MTSLADPARCQETWLLSAESERLNGCWRLEEECSAAGRRMSYLWGQL